MIENHPLITIVGPTASGKTGLAIDLAKALDGEVISADSRQVYRGLDIGTAKVTGAEKDGIPHHLIDIVDVTTVYTAHDFVRDARTAIRDIESRNQLPIIAGGTFFYLDALLGKTSVAPVPPNRELRSELEQLSLTELQTRLAAIDPDRFAAIDQANPRRLIRAIEIAETQDLPVPQTSTETSPYHTYAIGLQVDKDTLRSRYQSRAESWLHNSFLTEITTLLANGITRERLREIGFEYVLGLELLDGTIDESAFIQKFIEKNWQYAKRQYTWLKRDTTIHWYEYPHYDQILGDVTAWLKTKDTNTVL